MPGRGHLFRRSIESPESTAGLTIEMVVRLHRPLVHRLVARRSDQVFEERGVMGDIDVSGFPLRWIPMDEDLLSMQLQPRTTESLFYKMVPPGVTS